MEGVALALLLDSDSESEDGALVLAHDKYPTHNTSTESKGPLLIISNGYPGRGFLVDFRMQ